MAKQPQVKKGCIDITENQCIVLQSAFKKVTDLVMR
jgi:hypothetical protein